MDNAYDQKRDEVGLRPQACRSLEIIWEQKKMESRTIITIAILISFLGQSASAARLGLEFYNVTSHKKAQMKPLFSGDKGKATESDAASQNQTFELDIEGPRLTVIHPQDKPEFWPICSIGHPFHRDWRPLMQLTSWCSFSKLTSSEFQVTEGYRIGKFAVPHISKANADPNFMQWQFRYSFHYDGASCSAISLDASNLWNNGLVLSSTLIESRNGNCTIK